MASMVRPDCSPATTPRHLPFNRRRIAIAAATPSSARLRPSAHIPSSRPLSLISSRRSLCIASASADAPGTPNHTAAASTENTAKIIDGKAVAKQIREEIAVEIARMKEAQPPAPGTVAKIIDGKAVAKQIREEIAVEIARMKEAVGVVPGLAVVLVGERKDSQTYVRNKKKACEGVGIKSFEVNLPDDTTEEEVIKHILEFNDDPAVHGILVQLPLPRHLNEENILNAVSIEKDVDGFHPLNIGRLAMQGRDPLFVPCTPKGCLELLHRFGTEIKGKRAVVIGRSNIVGMPAALLLQRENATVSIVHSRTDNPEEITRQADIVISAVGVANLVRGSWLKPGAVVIDVGINPVDDVESPRGYRLVGDVCYEEACKVASAITPVPGGVGPMTIAMLLSNTLSSAKRINNFN